MNHFWFYFFPYKSHEGNHHTEAVSSMYIEFMFILFISISFVMFAAIFVVFVFTYERGGQCEQILHAINFFFALTRKNRIGFPTWINILIFLIHQLRCECYEFIFLRFIPVLDECPQVSIRGQCFCLSSSCTQRQPHSGWYFSKSSFQHKWDLKQVLSIIALFF